MLPMKTIGEYLLYGLVGLALAVGGCWWYAASGFDFRQVLMLILGLTFVAASVCLLWRDGKDELKRSRNASKEKKEWSKVARIRIALPFDELTVNFKALAKATDEAVAEKGYLSWNSGSFGDIRIQKIDAESWMALFWVRSDWTLTDRQVEGICRRESGRCLHISARCRPMEWRFIGRVSCHCILLCIRNSLRMLSLPPCCSPRMLSSPGSMNTPWIKKTWTRIW